MLLDAKPCGRVALNEPGGANQPAAEFDLGRRSNLHESFGSLIGALRHVHQLGLINFAKLAVVISWAGVRWITPQHGSDDLAGEPILESHSLAV